MRCSMEQYDMVIKAQTATATKKKKTADSEHMPKNDATLAGCASQQLHQSFDTTPLFLTSQMLQKMQYVSNDAHQICHSATCQYHNMTVSSNQQHLMTQKFVFS